MVVTAVVAGLVVGATVLALLGWHLRLGLRPTMGAFVGVTTVLLVGMAVVFTGHRMARCRTLRGGRHPSGSGSGLPH